MADPEKTARLQATLESLLCAQGEPLTVERVAEVIGGVTRGEVIQAFSGLQAEYERDGRGLRIAQVAGGYQLRTAPENAEYVRRLLRDRPMRLTRAMLETLAIVAYKQLVTRAEIEAIRGVDADSALNTLLERRLISVAGRKETPGRPLLYATSREFLEVFGLKDLSELPTLKELGHLEIQMAPEIDLREQSPASGGSGEDQGTRADVVHLGPTAGQPQDERSDSSPENQNQDDEGLGGEGSSAGDAVDPSR